MIRRPEPLLSAEASQLIDSLPWSTVSETSSTRTSELDNAEVVKLVQRIATSPTRAGVEALAWFAWSWREDARKQHPDDPGPSIAVAKALEKQCKASTDWLDRQERVRSELEQTLKQLVSSAYAQGAKDALAKLAEDQSKPVSRVVKTVHEDSRGHVTHITEEAYRT